MNAADILQELETFAVPEIEAVAQGLVPLLPVDAVVRFAEWLAATLTATSEAAQKAAAEQAIIAADDAAEALVANKP